MNLAPGFLSTPVVYLKGVGPAKAELLEKELGIVTILDLLYNFPFRYIDRTKFHLISELRADISYVQVKGVLGPFEYIGAGRVKRLKSSLSDSSGSIPLVWFQGHKWIQEQFKPGESYVIFGKPTEFGKNLNFVHPEIESLANAVRQKGMQGVYPSTEKLRNKNFNQKQFRQLLDQVFSNPQFNLPEIIPASIMNSNKLVSRTTAIRHIHQPPDEQALRSAIHRLKYEELLILQLRIVKQKLRNKDLFKGIPFLKVGNYFNQYFSQLLPFELTDAQKRVLKEIREDLRTGKQMNRLLQGDVGSGKSVVAFMLMLLAADNDTQSSLMAPTEILAFQHYENMKEPAEKLGLGIALLTGSTKAKARSEILEGLANGEIKLLIGTHALIEDRVKMKRQGLAIIDEQHRFGVAQRAKMWDKSGEVPHILVMTATPIPRTLAMTIYGDLDISVIDQLPSGRKPIQTLHINEAQRMNLIEFIRKQIESGRQIYVVYPLIEESEKMSYNSLMEGFDFFSRFFPRPEFQVDIIHGKMKPAEKEFVMDRFKQGLIQILISTTVIEVGINVPNATTMVIENAERFGLSQLHQLRGRVGRGSEQSYCILLSGREISSYGLKRIKAMQSTQDGFKLAEMDLTLRGPGDIEGTQQSGLPDLKLAKISGDEEIMAQSRKDAEGLLAKDPNLEAPEQQSLKSYLRSLKGSMDWSRIS